MNEQIDCIRCHSHMETGYIADFSYGGYVQQNWSPGEPKTGFWKTLKIKAGQFVPVTTFRCPECGYLESYAIRTNRC